MTENGSAKHLLLRTLSQMCEQCLPGTATILVYNILLGRDPDPDGEAFYGARIDGPPVQRLSALRELALSEEAQRYGLFSLSPAIQETDVDAVHLPESPFGVLALLGLMRRRMIETMERLDNIENLVRITLLSVPEWCGSAYTDLERRVGALEAALARGTRSAPLGDERNREPADRLEEWRVNQR